MRLAPSPLSTAPDDARVYGIAMPPAVAPCEWPQNASVPALISACVGDDAGRQVEPRREAHERHLVGRALQRVAARGRRVREVEEEVVRRVLRRPAPRPVLDLVDAEDRDTPRRAVADRASRAATPSGMSLRKLPPVPCA